MFAFLKILKVLSILFLIIKIVSASLSGERHSYFTVKLGIGEAVKFYCPHQRFANYPLKWTKQSISEPIAIAINGENSWIHEDYRNRTEINIHNHPYSKSYILLKNVLKSDQGMYSCQERMSKNLKANTEIRTENKWVEVLSNNYIHTFVIVVSKLNFKTKPPQLIYSQPNEKVIIDCEVDGISVDWFKDKKLINHQSLDKNIYINIDNYQVNGKRLIINPHITWSESKKIYSELYTCRAKNEIEKVEASTLIKFVEKLYQIDPVKILTAPQNQTVVVGFQARFDCDVFAISRSFHKNWLFNGNNIITSEAHQTGLYNITDHELVLNKVMISHAGNYTCYANDYQGNNASATAYLNVEYPAQVTNYKKVQYFVLGQSDIINCDTIANPPLTDTKWIYGNLSFDDWGDTNIERHGIDSLFFKKVMRRHAGTYYCLPINPRTDLIFPVDNIAQEIEVIVQDPLFFTSIPPLSIIVKVGDSFNLTCSGSGAPKPKVSWNKLASKNSLQWTQVANLEVFNLKHIVKQDEGLYKCTLSNGLQSIEYVTRIKTIV